MQICKAEQGTEQWFKDRIGCITGSNFKMCREVMKSGKNKGGYGAKAKSYALKLAMERIGGEIVDEQVFQTWEMKRGNELEGDARLLYEERNEVIVEQAGFIKSDCGRYGVSLDGLIDGDGSNEIKCFTATDKIVQILCDGDTSDIDDQMQGGMWISGREWCDFILYLPHFKSIDKELYTKHVRRDDEYIEKLVADLKKFDDFVEENVFKIKKSIGVE